MNVFLKPTEKVGKLLLSLFLVLTLGSVLSAQTWIELTPATPNGAPPDPFYGFKRISYDAASNRLIVFYPGKDLGNKVWVLTNANGLGGTPEWIPLYPTGSPSASNGGESVVYDAAFNRLIVYGGCYASCGYPLWDVFVLENANGVGQPAWWQTTTVPWQDNRAGHSSVYDPFSNRMISFGGGNAYWCPGCNYNDTRILTNANGLGGSSAWSTLTPAGGLPGVRVEHTAVYDQVNNRMTLFAGTWLYLNWYDPSHGHYIYDQRDYNDVWVLSDANGTGSPAWTQLCPAGGTPALRSSHSSVYDPTHNRMIMFGGVTFNFADQTSTPLGDLWELSYANGLDGVPTWTELSPSGTAPGPRFMHTAAFDTAHQRMIVFGGRNDNVNPPTSNRVWVLILADTEPPIIDSCPSNRTLAADSSCGASVPDLTFEVGATDNVGVDSITQSPAAGSALGPGPTTVTITVADAAGNSSSCTSVITVLDATPPALIAPPDLSVQETDPLGTEVNLGRATASDNCDPLPRVVNDAPALFALGETTVAWQATDASGNGSTVPQKVTVVPGSPGNQLSNLAKLIQYSGASGGIASDLQASLLTKVSAAGAALARGNFKSAANNLKLLISQVQAQTGKKINAAIAAELILRANRAVAAIGG